MSFVLAADRAIAFRIGSLEVRWYGILIAFAMLLGILIAMKQAKKHHLSEDDVITLCLFMLPAAILGARIYFVIFYGVPFSDILKIRNGGLAFHGGLIAAVLVVLIYAKMKGQKFFAWADTLIPSCILGQAIGRWGNYFNGEAYGTVTDLPWAILIDGVPRHPTFLYESIADFLIFLFLLWLLSPKRKGWQENYKEGSALAWYLILYSLARFFVEGLRTDSLYIGPLRVAQVVSVVLILIGVGLLLYLRKYGGPPQPARRAKKERP